MMTTISVSTKRQVVLPKGFCDRKKIKPGTALRVTEVGDGLFFFNIAAPTERELREVVAIAGSLRGRQTVAEETMVQNEIQAYRLEKHRHKK